MSAKIRTYKLTAWLLTFAMFMTVLSGFSITAFAAETASDTCGENLTWNLDDTGKLTISGAGAMADYGWEENVAPWGDYEIKTVVIESGVKTIGDYAFNNCGELTSVTIPEGVETIGEGAFYGCDGFESIEIPSSVKSIGDLAFSNCDGIIVYVKSKEPAALGVLPFHDATDATNMTASKIIVPTDAVETYKDEWYEYADIIEPELVDVSYIDENGDTQVCTDYTVVESDTTTLSEGWYVVTGEVTVNSSITASGNIHLILADESKLTVVGDGIHGIYTDGNLSIYAQSDGDNVGALEAKSSLADSYGVDAENNLNIIGGAITAEGEKFGIAAETITISGGEISAKSNNVDSVGIYAVGNIDITGGSVETKTGELGYGIYSRCGDIAISGGSVKAAGDGFGIVAIGYKEDEAEADAENGNITISGGIVDAFSEAEGGVGIYARGTINIYGGDVSKYPIATSYFTCAINSSTNHGCAIYGGKGITVGNMLTITTPEGGAVNSFSDDDESFYAVAQSDGNMAVEVTITPVEFKNPFTDVNASDWYYEDVIYAALNGLFNGITETTFAPNNLLTRAMLVTVLYRAAGEPEIANDTSFADVENGSYYEKAVAWAQHNSIVNGISETEFAPDQNITREQVAAIIYRYAVYKGMEAVTMEENLHFADSGEISEYAVSAMNWAVGSGLLKGKTDSTLNPLDNATRAEIAAMLRRFIEANN